MKKTNKLISILLVMAMLLSVTPLSFITSAAAEITPTEPTLTTDKYDVNGDDTKDAVYEITTASELYWFAGLVNGTLSGVTKNNSANAILMNNITVNENVIVDGALTTDISNLVVWTAIGKSFSSTSQFKGHFDGNNKTISGLYVNDTVTYRGFVGYLGGSVKNLTIADSYFYSTNTSLGAIAGSAASGSSIENCKLTGSIVSGKGSVGGIVGYVAAGVTLTNCHTSESEILGTADKIGGIVGSAGGNNSSNKSYIRLCAITDSSVNGASDVGGILGRGGSLSYTYIIGCCNYGTDVTATTKNAGGIVGYYAAIYSSFSSAKVSAPTKQGPFYGASGNAYASAYDSTVYGEAINYASSKSYTTTEIESGVAAYYLANSTSSSTNAYSQWGQKIGEDEYPVWNADNNADYIVYREDDPDAEGGYRYYNGDAAAAYEPNEDGIYEITNRLDWYKFAKKSKEDPTINGILTDNIDFSAVISDKIGDYRIGEDDAYTGSFDGDGYTVSGLPQMELPLFDTIGSGGELKNLTLSGATVNYISSTPAVGLVENNNGTVSGCAVSDITIIGSTSSAMIGTNRGTVTNCTATNITVAGKSAAAGIVYLNTGTIEKCNVVSGTVKAVHTENYDSHAGGICVRSGAGTIRECSNNADVTAESSSTVIYAAAGIVAAPSDGNGASVQVIKCFNSGDIKGGYAGGISGYDNTSAYVNISLCYNEGAITGGIAGGIAASGSYNASDKILNCYNAGDVNATSKAGGIAGEQGNCIIENCHNYAKIVSSNVGAPIVGYSSGVWPGPDKLINNHAIEGNVEASYVSPYLDTKGAASNFDAITVGSTREEFADGTITAKLNAGNSETVWYQHSEYPILEQRHMHKWEYSLVGTDSIKAKCVNAGCDLDNNDGGSMTIVAPAELVYDGTSKDADCTYNEWKPGKPAIVYNDIDRTNVTGQNIVASVTAGEATASVSYQIQPREIIASMVTLSKTSVSYNGTEQSTTVTVKYDTNTTLTASVDYEITGTTSATEISTGDGYAVTVTGKGNYIGTVTKYWKINKGSLSTQLILESWNYLDTPNEPYVTNNPENAEVTYTYYISTGRRPVMTGSANGAETEGGVPSYAGTYYIGAVIAATEHYNSKTISPVAFTIAPREVNNPDFEGLQETYLYDNGNEIKPAFTLKDDKGNVISDSEYTVVYSDNTDAGVATITITDNAGGNYNVSGSTKFTIITHQHDWIYSANGDTITATCANTDTGCLDTNGGYITIFAPTDLYADGITAKEATIENNLVDTSVAISDITYSAPYGLPPKDAGTYTASVTVGGATVSVEFELVKRSAAADNFIYTASENLVYDGTAKYATVEVSPEITGMGAITVTYYKDGEAVEPINAGTYTVKVSTAESDKYYAINDVELASFTINAKDISDGFIILGDALTYNGKEQTQTVEKVIPTGTAPEATFTVSGNKATNVGVYLLTVTGTGNFTGEAKIAYEIAVDVSGLDYSEADGYYWSDVKSTDKDRIEYVYNQIRNASTEYADEDKKAEWNTLLNNCNEMLLMIKSVTDHLESFKEEVAGYDIDTVTSDDYDYLEGLYESEGQWLYDHGENYTDEEIKEFSDTLDDLQKLKIRISDVAEEITRITNAVNGYDEATVKYGDYKDILQLIDDIEALTTGKNITDFERADLEELNAKANLLAAKIRSTADEISRITRAVNAYNIDTVKSSDKADIENLISRIKKLTDGDNITADERANLNELDSILDALLAKIDETADELARLEAEVGKYDEATVKSSDKTDLEQLKADIKALTDGQNITADERAKLENLDATADALLAKIAETKSEYDRVIAAANGYDEATVTSADKDALVQLNDDIYALALTDNVTAEELENLENAHNKVLALIDKLTAISDEIKRIIEAVDKYVFESVKSSDKADIQQLIADIKELLDTQNITADERTLLEGADETCDKLIAKIDETVAEINRINAATNAYDEATVTSADKADIEKLLADIKALTDGDNITDAEREQLNGNEATLKALLDKIGATADEIARIETAVNGYDEETVKSTDKADLEQLKADIKALTDATNITEDEKTKLGELDATVDSLIKKIDDTAAEIERIDEAVNGYDKETVTSADIPELGKLIDDIKALTDGDNLTEDEKAALEEADKAIDELVEKLTEVAEEIKKVDEAVKSYDEETVKSTDSEDLTQLKEDIQNLIDSDNTTENEKAALEEMIKDIKGLEDKIEETAKEIERIENAVNGYNEETVKSSDEEAIEQLKEDIQSLIDSGNLTEEEIAGLEETKADADALTDKIDETQAEIDRINDAVAGYDEETVKSTDSEDLAQLKEDIQKLIDSGNLTEEEIAGLEETKADADALTDKITETEEKLEEIKNIENNFNPETVSSDDKAAIEDKIAEIEAVNPDNLTDEQKAEYEEIKAGFESLLDKIQEASKAVTDIAVELEMFDEERVTKFWEDDIEALKAKIDELLADENMGEAEKAKLNEYKAQAEKLIKIINTPKEYFSLRFFYLIWDCLTWKYNGILWLFSKIFGC